MAARAKEIQKQWKPQTGDFMIRHCSYCGDMNEECSNEKPCDNCIEMDNVFVISNVHNGSKSVGGKHWFYFGHLCNRDGGCLLNSTASEVIIEFPESDYPPEYKVSEVKDFLWIPRPDQLIKMVAENDGSVVSKLDSWNYYNINKGSEFDFNELVFTMYMRYVQFKNWNNKINNWE